MISKKLLETYDYIAFFYFRGSYYNEEEDTFNFFGFTKDTLITVFLIRYFIKIIKETYILYLSFKYYVKEIQQNKNKLKKN